MNLLFIGTFFVSGFCPSGVEIYLMHGAAVRKENAMFKVIATDVVVSKGYDNTPALKFSERGDSVRFRIGKKVYDTRAKDNHR